MICCLNVAIASPLRTALPKKFPVRLLSYSLLRLTILSSLTLLHLLIFLSYSIPDTH